MAKLKVRNRRTMSNNKKNTQQQSRGAHTLPNGHPVELPLGTASSGGVGVSGPLVEDKPKVEGYGAPNAGTQAMGTAPNAVLHPSSRILNPRPMFENIKCCPT